jgi:23S rRNA 5-hydroxycytidine C2501 synthase
VKQIERNGFILDTEEILHNGDGICFFDVRNELQGTNINKIEGKKIFPSEIGRLEIGTTIYRNYDYAFARELQADKTKRLISVKIKFAETNNGFAIHIEDEDGVKIKFTKACEKNPAKNKGQAEETISHQLTKLGDSIFVCDEMIVVWSHPYFLPIRVCNEMRREGIRILEEERLKFYNKQTFVIQPNNEPYPSKQLDYLANVANKKAEEFYRRHGVEKIENAFELQKVTKGKTVMTMKHCLRFQYGLCTGKSISGAEPLFLHDAKNRYRLEFDCEVCQMKIMME